MLDPFRHPFLNNNDGYCKITLAKKAKNKMIFASLVRVRTRKKFNRLTRQFPYYNRRKKEYVISQKFSFTTRDDRFI